MRQMFSEKQIKELSKQQAADYVQANPEASEDDIQLERIKVGENGYFIPKLYLKKIRCEVLDGNENDGVLDLWVLSPNPTLNIDEETEYPRMNAILYAILSVGSDTYQVINPAYGLGNDIYYGIKESDRSVGEIQIDEYTNWELMHVEEVL